MSNADQMVLRSVRVNREHIGYLKWLLESHDGMATPTTRKGEDEIVDMMVCHDFIEEFDELIDALVVELSLRRIPVPAAPPL